MSTTLFSCTADELVTEAKKTEFKPNTEMPQATTPTKDQGPDDDPIPVNPPPKK